jgi:type II protein arginine methyltransferase
VASGTISECQESQSLLINQQIQETLDIPPPPLDILSLHKIEFKDIWFDTMTKVVEKYKVRPSPRYIERSFPTWHFSMMSDETRNSAIENCIKDAGVAGKLVFEIGTGAGLAAMLFAKHGAKKIVTCEVDDQMYSIARKTIAKNNLGDKINIFHGSSADFINSVQTNFSPDIIFTETLDCGVVGEGFHSIAHDIQKIYTHNTTIFPTNIIQYSYMIESNDIYSLSSTSFYRDIDLSVINIYSTKTDFPVRYHLYQAKSLSVSEKMNSYSYTHNNSQHTAFCKTAYRNGTCHGILSFFYAFYGNHVVSNDTRDRSHWHQGFHPLTKPICIKAGKSYQFSIDQFGLVTALE